MLRKQVSGSHRPPKISHFIFGFVLVCRRYSDFSRYGNPSPCGPIRPLIPLRNPKQRPHLLVAFPLVIKR